MFETGSSIKTVEEESSRPRDARCVVLPWSSAALPSVIALIGLSIRCSCGLVVNNTSSLIPAVHLVFVSGTSHIIRRHRQGHIQLLKHTLRLCGVIVDIKEIALLAEPMGGVHVMHSSTQSWQL